MEFIGSTKIEKNKMKKRETQKLKPGKCSPYLTNLKGHFVANKHEKQPLLRVNKPKNYIRCSTTSTVPAATSYIWWNKQYVGKAKTSFYIRRNNHRKDVKNSTQ